MEDQFREAAENYHLPTEKAFDWEKISSALSEKGDDPKNKEQDGRKKRRFVFWYLLFIPLGWFAHYAFNYQAKNNVVDPGFAKQPIAINTKPGEKIRSQKEAAIKIAGNNPTVSSHPNKPVKNYDKPSFNITLKRAAKNPIYTGPALPGAVNENKKVFLKTESTTYNTTNQENAPAGNITTVVVVDDKSFLSNNQVTDAGVVKQQDATVSLTQKNKVKNKEKGFYAGLLFAPDISFIKFQRASRMGSSFGAVAGYALNKNWSIETGISSDKKNYYTTGKYFDKSQIPYFNDKQLLSVDGNCRMIEIPLNIRYTFQTANKSAFTATLGTSSYFMNEEYYDYSYMAYGQNSESNWEYNAPSKKLFAVINLGAGYQRNIGKNLSLRFEPYAKIPIGGIGTGNLSVTSTGINIGITRSFHR